MKKIDIVIIFLLVVLIIIRPFYSEFGNYKEQIKFLVFWLKDFAIVYYFFNLRNKVRDLIIIISIVEIMGLVYLLKHPNLKLLDHIDIVFNMTPGIFGVIFIFLILIQMRIEKKGIVNKGSEENQ